MQAYRKKNIQVTHFLICFYTSLAHAKRIKSMSGLYKFWRFGGVGYGGFYTSQVHTQLV
jgi:hypothetical protein